MPQIILSTISPDWFPGVVRVGDCGKTSVYAAYNKRLGTDRRTGDTVIGYFNHDLELFAWSYMMDDVKDIGNVADSYRMDWHFRHADANEFPNHPVCYLLPKMEAL